MAKKKETLYSLAELWLSQKNLEEQYKQERIGTEELIAALLPGPDEGTESTQDSGLKISVTRKLTRTIDLDRYEEVKGNLPKGLIRLKPDLDLKVYRAVELANPEAFALVQKVISVKPAKASVRIEEVKENV